MKNKMFLLQGIFLSVFILLQNPVNAKGIVFVEGSWADAIAAAKKAGKPLFVDAYAEWCGPCKVMAKDVFPDEKVGEFYNANFVSYKMDVDTDEGKMIFAKYGGSAMPTYLFIDAKDESVMYKQLGSVPAQDFIEIGQKALKMPATKAKYKSGKMTDAEKVEYWIMAEGDESVKADVQAYLGKQKEEDLVSETNFGLMKSFVNNSESREFQYFINNTDKFKTKYKEETLQYFGTVFEAAYPVAVEKQNKKLMLDLVAHLEKFKEYLPADFNMEDFNAKIKADLDEKIK